MKSVPGTRPWQADLVGFTLPSDWENDNGGVILFDDGTIWSYEAESPAAGDQSFYYPWFGFNIMERKPGSVAWERLTPDSWGLPYYGQPFGYTTWPAYSNRLTSWTNLFTGPLADARIGWTATGYMHVQEGNRVWLYNRFGEEPYGPILIDRDKRTWERFLVDQDATLLYEDISSNIVIDGQYMWFLAYPRFTCTGYNGQGMRLIRVDKDNPGDMGAPHTIVHQWLDDKTYTNLNTSNLSMPDFIDEAQQMRRAQYCIAIKDGYLYVTGDKSNGVGFPVTDSRTVSPDSFGNGVNHDMLYTGLWRTRIGEPYDLELLYWHSNQGWVGRDVVGGGNGSWYDGTIGITNMEDGGFDSDRLTEPLRMGFIPNGQKELHIVDDWLYWWDYSGHFYGVYGTQQMICRMKLGDLTPGTPIQHNGADPIFEVITNGNVPWYGNAGHLVRYGPWIWWRAGSEPLMPHGDNTLTFDDEGNIWYKCMTFPPYMSPEDGYGTRTIIKLSEPVASTANVTLKFDGDELKGYTAVRQIPKRSVSLEVELS